MNMDSLNKVSDSSNHLDQLDEENANYLSVIPDKYGSETGNQNDQNEVNPTVSDNLSNKSSPGSSSKVQSPLEDFEAKKSRHEASTQATPQKSMLVSTTSLPRSLRIITSLNSAASISQREVLTVNTDYGSGSSGACSLLLGVIEETNQPHLRIETRDQNMETTIQIATSELSDLPPPRDYNPSRNIIRRSRNRHWISKCCNKSGIRESDEIIDSQPYSGEAPPSYTSIYTRPRPNCNEPRLPFLPIDNGSSFEVPIPPPSYAQTQGICMTSYSMDRLISVSSTSGRFLSSQSTAAVCPRCATYILTVVDVHRSMVTHITALVLFMCGCWPCCMIPYCVDSCQTAHHYCPICRSYLGTYTPW